MREKIVDLLEKTFEKQYDKNLVITAYSTANYLVANDVVQVVRCKDCKFGEMCSIREAMCCTDENGFCWRGERKDNDRI